MAHSTNKYIKYCRLSNLSQFVDILYNKRLYGAKYDELNDPKEGCYIGKGLDDNIIKQLDEELKNVRICSFQNADESQINNNKMWAHYAEGHKGCCIKFKLDGKRNVNKTLKAVKIDYRTNNPSYNKSLSISENVDNFLLTKNNEWIEENEYRVIKHLENNSNNKFYYYIKIEAIYLGCKMSKADVMFYKKLIKGIDPKIMIYQMELDKDKDNKLVVVEKNSSHQK